MKRTTHSNFILQFRTIIHFAQDKLLNIVAILICVSLIVFLNSYNNVSVFMRNILLDVNAYAVSILNKPFELVKFTKEYLDETLHLKQIAALQAENRVLSDTIKVMHEAQSELILLKEMLNLQVAPKYDLVTTRLIQSSINVSAKNFMMPIGTNHSINDTTFVVSGVGLIGKVVEVGYDHAKVRLITSINSKTPVVFSQSREKAILAGDSLNSNTLRIIYCTNADNIIDGEMVLTSGDGNVYPYGIAVGQVSRTGSQAQVTGLFDSDKLEFVKAYTPSR